MIYVGRLHPRGRGVLRSAKGAVSQAGVQQSWLAYAPARRRTMPVQTCTSVRHAVGCHGAECSVNLMQTQRMRAVCYGSSPESYAHRRPACFVNGRRARVRGTNAKGRGNGASPSDIRYLRKSRVAVRRKVRVRCAMKVKAGAGQEVADARSVAHAAAARRQVGAACR